MIRNAALGLVFSATVCLLSQAAFAQQAGAVLPSSADTTRVDKDLLDRDMPVSPTGRPGIVPRVPLAAVEIPEGAAEIVFQLDRVEIKGSTIYSADELASLCKEDAGKAVPLTRLYEIAARLTQKYREDGYVLSRAFVPAQEIENGTAHIAVVEGYIATVNFEGLPKSRLLRDASERLKAERPLNIKTLERQMLLLNDLGGHAFRAVLQPSSKTAAIDDGGVVLSVVGEALPAIDGTASLDNSGSRYIGPYLSTASIGVNRLPYLPFDRTEFFGTTTVPADELKFGSVRHIIPLTSDGLTLGLNAGVSKGRPGYRLKASEIETDTVTLGADLDYSVIRQRDENLTLRAAFDTRKSTTDVLDSSFTKDKIRALRLGARYDGMDRFDGYGQVGFTLSHGLSILDASRAGDQNLSRARGKPDFLKGELNAFRTQPLLPSWSLLTGFSGQYTNDALLSAEEFGYGGGSFGRGFNPSEILGDKGFAVLAEVRHDGWMLSEGSRLQPFGFYDFGKVWNLDEGQEKMASGASVGGGLRLYNTVLPDLSLTVAQPLSRRVDAPQYGNGRNPRVLFSLSYDF